VSTNGAVVVAKKLGAVVEPLQVLQSLVEYADKWVAEVQRAKIERAEIAAWGQVQTDKIRAQRDVLLKALDLTFDERRENFHRLFDGLDAAMQAGNAAQATSFLESITDLAKTSPFQDLANVEIIAAELKRPDKTWDV
jgi:hypothetical protein